MRLRPFLDAAEAYFLQTTGTAAQVGTPYLPDEDTALLDCTAVVGISGSHQGYIYFSTRTELLELVLGKLGEPDLSLRYQRDLAGEIANTLAGNARRDLGAEFMISVPRVTNGKPRDLRALTQNQGMVIPIQWEGIRSYLVVRLEGVPWSAEPS